MYFIPGKFKAKEDEAKEEVIVIIKFYKVLNKKPKFKL